VGLDTNRISLLAAILEKHMHLDLAKQDLFFNVAGGLRLSEPACDLAAAAAIWSSDHEIPLPSGWLFLGELGLTGEIRRVSQAEVRLAEAKKLGFEVAVVPQSSVARLKKIEGIRGLRDESTRDIRVVIELKAGAHPQKVLNYLYKHTALEDTFHFNMVVLVDGVPQTLSLKGILQEFIKHRREVVRRRTQFDLTKAQEREHILLGLKKALDFIDEVIKIIRASKDVNDARLNLIKRFKFSELQANAILEMRLQKLANLERQKILDELKEIQELIAELEDLLKSDKKMLKLIKEETLEAVKKHGDDRETKIVKGAAGVINVEDLIPDEEQVLVLTAGGYVKRTNPEEYKRQKRGGIGVIDLNTKEEDFVTNLLTTSTHSDLLFFTDLGKAYQIKMYDIAEGKRSTKGKAIVNFLSISDNEKVSSVLPMRKLEKEGQKSLYMITKMGVAKKVDATAFHDVRRSGLIAMRLDKGDELISALLVEKGDEILLTSQKGQAIRFKESDIRAMGRAAGGVRGMKLAAGDFIVGADVVKKGEKDVEVLVVTRNGFGKTTPIDEYKVQNRGGSGIMTVKSTPKTGPLIAARVVSKDAEEAPEIVVISKKGQVIRTDLSEIPSLSRSTQGVRVMKLRDGDAIASFVCL
jgi:DNA gyrase subunit A